MDGWLGEGLYLWMDGFPVPADHENVCKHVTATVQPTNPPNFLSRTPKLTKETALAQA